MSFPGKLLQRAWHLIDASDQTVGRLATQIAPLLKGKHKPTYRPNKDMGDYVVIVNAEKVHFSGKKWNNKLYRWHTGYPGGLKSRTAKDMLERKPEQVLYKAIVGMLQKNNLRHQSLLPRLKIYTGPYHPHTAQLGTISSSSSSNIPPLLEGEQQQQDDNKLRTNKSLSGVEAQPLPRHPRKSSKQILFDSLPYTQEITITGSAGSSNK